MASVERDQMIAALAAAAAAVAGRQRGVLRRGARLRGARRLPEMRQLRPGGDALVQPRDLALLGRARRKQGTGPPRVHRLAAQKTRGEAGVPDDRPHLLRRLRRLEIQRLRGLRRVGVCVEINQCDGCTRQFFTKSFLGDDAAVLALSSGEEPASPRHRAGVASMAWRTTRRFSTNAP